MIDTLRPLRPNKKNPLFKGEQTLARIQKANNIIKHGRNPYPNAENLKPNFTIEEIVKYFNTIHKNKSKEIVVKGRLTFLRKMGKITFGAIKDNLHKIQYVIKKENVENMSVLNSVDINDILLIKGDTYITEKGEKSILVKDLIVCSKSIAEPIGKYNGLEDNEIKTRNRHLALIHDDELLKNLKERSLITSIIRSFFEMRDFIEVETPILHRIQGGANAKPFKTFYNSIGEERYLRVAPELYLKKLLVGGFDKVYEIGKNFRNEGMDKTHNPEFTSIEFYETFTTYKEHIEMIKDLFTEISFNLGLPYIEFDEMTYRDSIIKYSPYADIDCLETLSKAMKEEKFAVNDLKLFKLHDTLFEEYVEENLKATFITEYPIELSPLARRNDENPNIAERFELFIDGKEIANGFNELTDPIEQEARFKEQVLNKDDESMMMDKSFIEALKVGLPPCAGVGIGIDRLVMVMLKIDRIKDVITFPEYREL